MGFLDHLARGAEFRAVSNLARPAMWLNEAFGTSRSVSGQRVTVEKAIGVAPVWSAVSIISEAVGGLPFKVYRDVGEGEILPADTHRAFRMLHDKPNPVTPANRFWSTVTVHLLLWGNAYIEKVRGEITGLVEELWLLDPGAVEVRWDAGARRKYFIERPHMGGDERKFNDEQVLHITGLSMNGLTGESVISRCKNALGTAMAREEFEGGLYQRGAVTRGVIEHPGQLKAEGIKNIRESFTSIYGGSSNAHQTAVLEEGASFRQMSMPLSDLEFVSAQQMTRTDVAVMFKLPPAYLGGSTGDSLTYATVEGNQIQFAQNAVSPWTNTIAKAVGSDPGIFPFSSWYPEFVLEGLMRGDHPARAGFYKAMHDMEAMTVNEIRSKENMSPVPWGDERPVPPKLPAPDAIVAAEGDPQGQSANGNGNGNGQLTAAQLAALAAGTA